MREGNSVVVINLDIPKEGIYEIEDICQYENDADVVIKKYCKEDNNYDKAIVGLDDIAVISD
jgi:hypothetical protein